MHLTNVHTRSLCNHKVRSHMQMFNHRIKANSITMIRFGCLCVCVFFCVLCSNFCILCTQILADIMIMNGDKTFANVCSCNVLCTSLFVCLLLDACWLHVWWHSSIYVVNCESTSKKTPTKLTGNKVPFTALPQYGLRQTTMTYLCTKPFSSVLSSFFSGSKTKYWKLFNFVSRMMGKLKDGWGKRRWL